MPSSSSQPHRFRRGLVALAALLALLAAGLPATFAPPAAADTTAIADGAITWGVKTSWRGYTGSGFTLSGGVTQNASGEYVFPVDSGSYDSDTGTTTLSATGTVHWQTHWYPSESTLYNPPDGYAGTLQLYVLDVTLSDPIVTISADTAEITVEMVARDSGTWQMIDHGRVSLATLDILSSSPTVTPTTTTWTDIPAAWTSAGVDSIGYTEGLLVDPVSISYDGPGGAPDLSESWTTAGTTALALDGHTSDSSNAYASVTLLWADPQRNLAHFTWSTNVEGVPTRFVRAYDLDTLSPVGTALAITDTDRSRLQQWLFFDSGTGRLYYSSVSVVGPIDQTLRYDTASGTYVRESVPSPVSMGTSVVWDPERARAVAVAKTVPAGVGSTDYDAHEWWLTTYTRGEDGAFTAQPVRLPNGPTGWNRTWYGTTMRTAAIASDGSIVLPRQGATPAAGAEPLTGLLTHRISIEGTEATVEEIDGTDLPEAPPADQALNGYNRAVSGPDGLVYLVRLSSGAAYPAKVLQLRIDDDGAAVVEAGAVELGANDARVFVVDPVDGTLWGQAANTQHVVAVRDGRVVSDTFSKFVYPRVAGIFVGADRSVYTPAYDGEPIGLDHVPAIGLVRFERLGISPTVTDQPTADPVTLQTGESSATVELGAEAEGEPTPTVQWQRRAPGSSRFVDLAGQDGNVLEAEVGRGGDQAQYRAVFTNAAGRIASAPVTLDVSAAPLIETQPADQSVTAGTPATFGVQTSGNPEPVVTWQHRVAGYWQPISTDDNYAVSGGSLTVTDTDVDQTGSQFRAKITNAVDTAFSRTTRLTVAAALTEPQVATGGMLTWGVKESFRTYVNGPIAQGAISVTGATTNPDGTYAFPVSGGSYDPVTGKATVHTTGSVRFTGHHGALDLTISNLSLRHAAASGLASPGTLVADVVSKDMDTGEVRTYDDLELVSTDSGGSDSAVDGRLTLGPRTSTLTATGALAFAGFYTAGAVMDPVSGRVDLADASAPPVKTEPKASTVRITLSQPTYAYGASTTAQVQVTSAGATPTGAVTLTASGQTLTGVLANGTVSLRLPNGIEPGWQTVQATYAGTSDITGSSATTTYQVTRAKPRLRLRYLGARRAGHHGRVNARIVVPAGGKAATGQLLVRDRGRVIAATQLRAGDRGRAVIKLPVLGRGRHALTVTLAPSTRYAAVRSAVTVVKVGRA